MSDIRTVKVSDSVISDISPEIDFAVYSGASQSTYQRYPSSSASNSSLIWTVQVPSENIVIDRAVMITSPLSLVITVVVPKGTVAGKYVFNYGSSDCLQSFPLNSLFTTVTAQINNTTVSVNLQDIKDVLLKMNDPRKIAKYNEMTPTLPDQMFGHFSDAIATNSNPLGSFLNAGYDERLLPRGAHPVAITYSHTASAVAAIGGAPALLAIKEVDLPYTGALTATAGYADETYVITLNTIVTEPLFVPPFLWSESEYNNMGLLGVQNMTINCNIDGSCKRVFSSSTGFITNIALATGGSANSGFQLATVTSVGTQVPTSTPSLLFRFLSTQPSDLLQTKNVIPMFDYPRYLTSSSNQNKLLGTTSITAGTAGTRTATLTSNNIQINQIPDKFIIVVRRAMNSQNWNNTASFLQINSISINFNNQSGINASASPQDLWRMSVRNGSSQSWAEFAGQQFCNRAAFSATGSIVQSGASTLIPTIGSMLVLNPALDMSLPDYLSCGSLGNYNFQFTIGVTNQFNDDITPEIEVICVNSGLFVTQQGVSSVYSGILTKEMVLATKQEQTASPMSNLELNRKVGGNMMNAPLTALRGMMKKHHHHRHGGASSGGASSGGAESGGRLSKHY